MPIRANTAREWSSSADAERAPSSTPQSLASWYTPGLSDGLGDRLLMFDNSGAPSLELLRFRRELGNAPGFEEALREQVERLKQFQHPAFAAIRSVQRLEPDDDLALISNYTPGKRLSEVLHHVRGPEFASGLIKQLAPALIELQRQWPGISHGALNPDRIVVSPEGGLTIVEHALGPALDALNLGGDELASIGVAVPPVLADGSARLDVPTDWYQFGLVAVSVLIGRPVDPSEVPQLESLLQGHGLSPFVRQWLGRALQVSGASIDSGADAQTSLDNLLRKERAFRRVEPMRRDEQPATPVEAAPTPAPKPAVVPLPRPESVTGRPQALPAPDRNVEPQVPRQATPAPPRQVAPVPPRQAVSAPQRQSEPEVRPAAAAIAPEAAPPLPRPRPSRLAIGLIAALALIALGEAIVLAILGGIVHPAIALQSGVGSDDVVVSSRTPTAAPLQVAVAPDLGWLRVVAPGSELLSGRSAAATTSATIRIVSPIELKVFERSRLLGSVPGANISVAPGRHDVELVNEPLGYSLKQMFEVEAGQTLSIHVSPPPGTVMVHATPAADVSINGRRVGRTPLGPLPLALGDHVVTFQHASGARDQQRVTVRSGVMTKVLGHLRR